MTSDRERVLAALTGAGVAGTADFGHFVNDTTYLEPSTFDERAAFPILLDLFPTLGDKRAVETVARYLNRPWGRPIAFPPLLEAFRKWARTEPRLGWTLGDALATVATPEHAPVLLALARDDTFGVARQMIVDSLWRYRKQAGLPDALASLCTDEDVCLHAMSAYRRAAGNPAAAILFRQLSNSHNKKVQEQAARALRKVEKALAARQ